MCAPAGVLAGGGICTHLISTQAHDLTLNEMIDFLEAQPERTCVPVPGFQVCADDQTTGTPVKMPARGAAIAMSSDDWNGMKTELEEFCRRLGGKCSVQLKTASNNIKRLRRATATR